jgi:cobalt-zinc-cadmium efflux system membrane fusion protein
MPDLHHQWDLSGVPHLTRTNQLRLLAVAVALVVVVFGLGPFLWRLAFAPEPEGQPGLASSAFFRPTREQWSDLQFATVRRESFPGVVITDGEIAANDDTTTPVFSPYSGRVTGLLATPGESVRKGQPLIAIEASEAVQSRNDLIAAADAVDAAEAQEEVATKNEERQHALYMGDSGALKDWQQAQSDLATAQATLRSARAALSEERDRLRILGIGESEIAALEKTRNAASVTSRAVVGAPIAGTVIQRQVGLGQYVQAGAASPIFQIGDLTTVWIIGNVREADAPRVHPGALVETQIAALPGRRFPAKLEWVAPEIDSTTHRLAVRATLHNPDGALKPMMFAMLRIHVGNDRVSSALPEKAVIYEGDEAHVWLGRTDRSLAYQEVRVGRTQDGETEILSGLKPGDLIVTKGALFIDRAARPES